MPRTPHFVQITALGWTRFDTLVAWNGTAARLWTRLARSIDAQGVVITTAVALATNLDVSPATIRRHLAHLESVRAFVRFRLPGGLTAFAMNPNEVWSGKSSARARAPYITGVLGGDREGQASLRRGAWFLPGMEPVIPKSSPRTRPVPKTHQDSPTAELFALPQEEAASIPPRLENTKMSSDTTKVDVTTKAKDQTGTHPRKQARLGARGRKILRATNTYQPNLWNNNPGINLEIPTPSK